MRSMIADTHLLVILKNVHMTCQQLIDYMRACVNLVFCTEMLTSGMSFFS